MNRRTSRRTSEERQEVEREIGKKIYKFKKNSSYIKKQNKPTITNEKTKRFVDTKPGGTYCERNDDILGVDKTRNMEHSGTCWNIPEHLGTSRNMKK